MAWRRWQVHHLRRVRRLRELQATQLPAKFHAHEGSIADAFSPADALPNAATVSTANVDAEPAADDGTCSRADASPHHQHLQKLVHRLRRCVVGKVWVALL